MPIFYGGGVFYSGTSGSFYAGSGIDKPLSLNFYRTETDNVYTFHWGFNQQYIDPLLFGLDYQLDIDTNSDFSTATTYETITEQAVIAEEGTSLSGSSAATVTPAFPASTLDINIDGDGVQTITITPSLATGTAIAASIQTEIQSLTANNVTNQASISATTCTFDIGTAQYLITSGSTGLNSTVVVIGGSYAAALNLGVTNGGFERPGNTGLLSTDAQRVLIVENGGGVVLNDVTQSATAPAAGEYTVNLATNLITFNDADTPGTFTAIYVPTASGDIFEFQRGNVVKGYTIEVPSRIAGEQLTFYARVRVKSGVSVGEYSDTLEARTLEETTRVSSDRLLENLPDRHVYPVDEINAELVDRTTNISKIMWTYGAEFDRHFLEREHTIRDVRQERCRDARLFEIFGTRYGYVKPSTMEFVDYRLILGNMRTAGLTGGTIEAVKLIGRSFTGVDPLITPFENEINFITAAETTIYENITVPLIAPLDVTLSNAPRRDTTIPGSVIGGFAAYPGNAATTASGGDTLDINIDGDGAHGVSTSDASPETNIETLAATSISGGTASTDISAGSDNEFVINLDGDGAQTVVLNNASLTSAAAIAAEIQLQVRALTAITPANQPIYASFTAEYTGGVYVLRAPLATNSIVITDSGSNNVADDLELGVGNGGTETLTQNQFDINVNADGIQTITLGLYQNNTGEEAAAEMQSKIRALTAATSLNQPAYDNFTVEYTGGVYVFTSGRAGTGSSVVISDAGSNNIADDLKIGLANGGVEAVGTEVVQQITLDAGSYISGKEVAAEIEKQVRALTAVSPLLQSSFANFKVIFTSQNDGQYTLVSGNPAPDSLSKVICSGASLADSLLLKPVGGAEETTGLTYATPPAVPAAGIYTGNFDTGDGATLSFEFPGELGNQHTVVYKSIDTIYSWVPAETSESDTVPASAPYTFTLAELPANIPAIAGFTYTTGTPAAGEFTVDFSTGVLTFNSADASAGFTVTYVPFNPQPPILFSRTEAGFAIKITLNNPGDFELDLDTIEFLIKQIVPAHTKFVLEVN